MERVCQLFAGQARDKPIEILVRYSMDAPSHVIGDSTRVRQILTNLVGNAFKFTEQGHVLVDVAFEKKDKDRGDFIFNISDTGVGIPEDRLQEIFAKFSQGDESTTRRFGGTGLGLAICKQLVEMMGGEIGVESEPGKGSIFHFRLEFPCMDEPVPDEKIVAELSEISVLVVDDNEINRTIALEYLGSWNIPCEEAVSAGEAISRLRRAVQESRPFKIAIIDYLMPEMDGADLADAIKADKEISDTVLILLSSGVVARELRASTRVHFAASISKPIRASLFLHTLMDAWRRYRNGEPNRTDHEAPIPKSETAARIVRANVLLVEDNHINQRVAAGILRGFGCRVDVAGNGEEAVGRVREKSFDMIFMDAHMPVMDGFEATRKIREYEDFGARTPIIAMTALAMAGDRERCLKAGMDDYIAKPIKSKAIFDALLKYGSGLPGEDEAAPEEPGEIERKEKPVLNSSQLLDIGDHDEELILELIDE
ncbi:MAG: response regulator, partial [Desulfobacterales bacterium]|nr:response regulator [Desulfobacterales bacterium]